MVSQRIGNVLDNENDENIEVWFEEIESQLPFDLSQGQESTLREFLKDLAAPTPPNAPGERRQNMLTLDLTVTQKAELLQKGYQNDGSSGVDVGRWIIAKKLTRESAGEREFIVEPLIKHRTS